MELSRHFCKFGSKQGIILSHLSKFSLKIRFQSKGFVEKNLKSKRKSSSDVKKHDGNGFQSKRFHKENSKSNRKNILNIQNIRIQNIRSVKSKGCFKWLCIRFCS